MCDAMHLTEELVARYKDDRPGVRAMHFGDPGTLTCWANDKSFSEVFERQVRTFCTPRDVLVAISTSGNSENILRALTAARELGVPTIGLTGASGGKMGPLCDALLCVNSVVTARIQEIHISIIHAWCEYIDAHFRRADQKKL
jgi:D-sedoheptulose 7-phosphate isomerase